MKKSRLILTPTKHLGIVLFIAILLIVNSCKKYVNPTPEFNDNSIDLGLLKNFYNSDTIGASTAASMIKNRNVKWDRIYFQQRANSRVMEFDLNSDNRIWTTSPNPANYLNKAAAVFIDFNDGTHLNFYMKVIEDHTDTSKLPLIRYVHYNNIPEHFTGQIMLYSLNNKFINGYNYLDGKIKGQYVKGSTGAKGGARIQSTSPKLATVYQETDCIYGYTYGTYTDGNGNVTIGDPHDYEDELCFDYIYDTGSGGGDDGGFSNTGTGTVTGDNGSTGGGSNTGTGYPDCNTPTGGAISNSISVKGGKAVIQQVSNDGCPPVTQIAKVILDSNMRSCIGAISNNVNKQANIALVTNAYANTPSYVSVSNALNNIATSNTNNVRITEAIIPDVTDPITLQVSRTNANTKVSNGLVVITLNTNYLNTATDLSIARTIIHETIHAYFEYQLSSVVGSSDPADIAFINAHTLLFDKSGMPLSDPYGNQQHAQMVNNYIDGIAKSLEKYAISNGITSPDPTMSLYDYCHDLAWGGLQGTPAYNFLPASDQTRIKGNIDKENQNTANSTKVKGC